MLGQDIHLQVDPSRRAAPRFVRSQGLGDQRDRDAVLASALTVRLTPSTAIEPFSHQIARAAAASDLDSEHAGEALVARRADRADAIDVPLHDVAPDAIVREQGSSRLTRAPA